MRVRRMQPVWMTVCLACVVLNANAAEPLPQIRSFQPTDLNWVPRQLNAEPAYKSQNVRYNIWVLGNGRKSVMTLAWDESGGTGSGYDTLYADKNCNGDLTDAGERHFYANREKATKKRKEPYESYDVRDVKEVDGEKVFHFKFRNVYSSDSLQYNGNYTCVGPEGKYEVGPLPRNHLVMWSEDLTTAPIYHFGGDATPMVNGKMAGESLGEWEAGRDASAFMITAHFGSPLAAQLRFYGSRFPGLAAAVRGNRWGRAAYPFVYLRVLGKDGKTAEEIRFGDSCPCAGGFAPELTIPGRVPPGEHLLVARMLRKPAFGGSADFLWPVTIKNAGYGTPMTDPAYAALQKKFAGEDVKFATLRRVDHPMAAKGSYPAERIVPARVADNVMDSTNRDWDPRPIGYGSSRSLWIGLRPHHHDKSRGMVRFDLGGFAKGTEILGARIRLTLLGRRFSGLPADGRIEAVAIRREWLENRVDGKWCAWHGPKWEGKSGERWAKGGCKDTKLDCFGAPAGGVTVGEWPRKLDPKDRSGKAPRERRRIINLDISELAKQWHAGEVANHGVLLLVAGGGNAVIASSEFLDFPYRPALVVAYRGADPEPVFAKSMAPELVADLTTQCTASLCPAPTP